ncbi:DUF192 domain-containing protein [Aeromicrobium sp.]|uniref:DUF192 domain-containing protein n=1 Tax=Aeromicrobium sp. TaxID=1871063 RepID=UPI003D6ABA89
MPELVVDGRRVAPLELADSYRSRRHGLLKRDGVDGAFWLRPCRHVHTMGMRFAIDVALVDRRGRVLHTQTLQPGRFSAIRFRCRSVIEAEGGTFAGWELAAGSLVGVHDGS